MSLKKKLGLGVASAALGLSLVGGGTYAYFSDTVETNNTFAAGKLDLNVDPSTIIEVSDLKPGDWMFRTFKLENKGTLRIKDVKLDTSYTITDAKNNNNGADFADHIKVSFLVNADKGSAPILETTLANLQDGIDLIERGIFAERSGLAPGTGDDLFVLFEFVDNGDQNIFQGDGVNLKWTFNATQTAGTLK